MLECGKHTRTGYLRDLQQKMSKEQMGMNVLDLLGDLFGKDDAKETENKNTNDTPVETTIHKRSLRKQKNKLGHSNGNTGANSSNHCILSAAIYHEFDIFSVQNHGCNNGFCDVCIIITCNRYN